MTPETALRQAGLTAATYFDAAYDYFEDRGIKKPDPLLLAAFVNACSRDFDLVVKHGLVKFVR